MVKQSEREHKSHLVSHHNIFRKILLISILAVVVIAGIIIFAVPFPYTATEIYNESQPHTQNECTKVSVKGSFDMQKINSKCSKTNDVCANTETYCCDSGTECASYEQYCSKYDTTCAGYEQYCSHTNWYGGCDQYSTQCTSTQQTCSQYSSRCASTKSVCNKECTRCSSYNHPCVEYYQSCSATLRNVDDTGGAFTFTNKFSDNNGNDLKTEAKQVTVSAGSTGGLTFEYYSPIGNAVTCAGSITGYPTKTQCGDKIVYTTTEKERTVVKYATSFQQWTGRVQLRYKINET